MPAPFGLRLAIEALGVKYGGAATVLLDLLGAAEADSRIAEVHVFCPHHSLRRFDLPGSSKIREHHLGLAERNRLYRLLWLETGLPFALKKIRADVLICLSGAGLGRFAAPHLTFVQQSLPFSVEAMAVMSLRERIGLRVIKGAMSRSCRASNKVIVQTGTMAKVVGSAFNLPTERLSVVTPAARQLSALAPPLPVLNPLRAIKSGSRLLYVGNNAVYKNLPTLFAAVQSVRFNLPDVALALTIPRAAGEEQCRGVIYLGYLNDEALAQAYREADLLIMPSLQETVGLPLLEAMSLGTPILAADRPYAREICSDAAIYFNPLDSAALASSIENLLSDEPQRRRMIDRGYRISRQRTENAPAARVLDLACLAIKVGKNLP